MSLKELQKEFVNFIYYGEKNASLVQKVKAASVRESLNIYRESSNCTLVQAVESTFHSVSLIIGYDRFFNIAMKYLRLHPSNSGDLNLLAFSFPEFLRDKQIKPCYIRDMAIMDLAHHKTFMIADFACKSIEEFRNIPQDAYETLRFIINPTISIYELDYDIYSYWKHLRDTESPDPNIKIAKKKNHLLIARNSSNYIFAMQLSALELEFIKLCREEIKFIDVCEALSEIDPEFNLQAILQKFIQEQLIASFVP